MSNEGVQEGAIMMLALGEDEAAEVMKHLGPREVQKLDPQRAPADHCYDSGSPGTLPRLRHYQLLH